MFIGNEFETVLSNRRAHTIVMIGCTTDGGVEATVRDGYHRGYFMVVVRDCVATYTEEGHNAALKRMERFADVVDSQQLIRIWQRSQESPVCGLSLELDRHSGRAGVASESRNEQKQEESGFPLSRE
jgi:isochorismate hydrolase